MATAYLIVVCNKGTNAVEQVTIWSSPEWKQGRCLLQPTYVAYEVTADDYQTAKNRLVQTLHEPKSRYHWLLQYFDAERNCGESSQPDAVTPTKSPAMALTVVQDTVSRHIAIYVDGRLLRAEPYLRTYHREPPMAVVAKTTLRVYGEFPKQLCDVVLTDVITGTTPEKPTAGVTAPTTRATLAIPSKMWATEFVEKNNRFPHAIDYANAGYDQGSQCACTTVGDCVLRDACNGHHCDRNCYTQQLQDYIVMFSTKRAEPKQEDRPTTVKDLLSRILKLESQCRNNGKVPTIVRIPLWAESLLLCGAHLGEVRQAFRWQAGSWRPQSIYGLQCIWETEELVVE